MPSLPAPLRRALFRLRAILFRSTIDDDMQAEMRQHLDRATERYVARGLSPADARLAAKREFGNVTALQEEGRDARGSRWVEALIGDLHFALRYFARHKATTAIILTVIALSTGGNTLIFSLLQGAFIRPAPAVPSNDAHARIWAQERATRAGAWQPRLFTQPELATLTERRDIFRDIAAWTQDELVLQGGDSTGARTTAAQFVTPNYFSVLGVRLVAGQGLLQNADDTPDMTAVISYSMAEQLFTNPAAAVGKRILVNEIPVHVVGVAPERFQGAVRNMGEPALWMPLSARAGINRLSPRWLTDDAALSLFARLAPGASRDQASAFARLVVATALPDSAVRVGMSRTADVLAMHAPPPGQASNEMLLAFTLMFCIGGLVLLVGWMNVSSLMVASAVGRRHEIAVRLSLGASRARLLRQLVTESTLLAVTGSAAGLTLAWWVLAWRQKVAMDGVDVTPDVKTIVFVLLLSVLTGILFGLSPALHATRGAVASALRDSGTGTRNRGRLQRGFVMAQIALSQPLLVLLATLITLTVGEYYGLAPEMSRRVIAVGFRPLERTGAPSQRREAVEALLPRIAAQPEVESAVPDASGFAIRGIFGSERAASGATAADTVPTVVHMVGTAPGWFGMVEVPIVLGRDVSLADSAAADHPVVIGSDFARRLWGNASPIGRTLTSPPLPGWKQDSIAMTVVGVYDASVRIPGMTWQGGVARTNVTTRLYTAHGKQWVRDRVLIRARGPAERFLPALQTIIRAAAPSLPVSYALTLAQEDNRVYRDMIKNATMAAAGGALALLLASLGLYGVVSLAVRQRTREIGIRIAVGAEPVRVARMFLASGVRVSLVALALGLPLSIAALKIGMSQGLVIAPDVNPFAIGLVIAPVLLMVAAAATWLPARRAAQVDPARTLRVE